MPRLTDVNAILFPVEQRPLYSEIHVNGKMQQINVPHHKVIVNRTNGHILGVVSKDYQLLTNEAAIEMGIKCCRELFESDSVSDFEIFNVDAPSTGSYCQIDLVHKSYPMNLWDSGERPETYIPFVRVTNSYNKTRALRFDIGFCRKICLNGVIFEQQTIRFTFSHVRHELKPKEIRFEIRKGQLKTLFSKFSEFTKAIKEKVVSIELWEPIALAVFGLPTDEMINAEKSESRHNQLEAVLSLTRETLRRYQKEMGCDGYALFNAMSELASNRSVSAGLRKDLNAMQREVGKWLNNFHDRITKSDFDLNSYCDELQKNHKKVKRFGTL